MEDQNSTFDFQTRLSDTSWVEAVWQTRSETAGSFISTAESRWEMVVTKYQDQTTLSIRGPETVATPAEYAADTEFFGIIFKLGTFMPHLPFAKLIDRQDIHLSETNSQTFWLHGTAWQFPTFENADTFVGKLIREGVIEHEPVVDAVLQNRPLQMSVRSIQRRFLRATGLTHGTFDQIERARQAVHLLAQGSSIADAVYWGGYADQPHLTRSLKRFIGQTPAQILRDNLSE